MGASSLAKATSIAERLLAGGLRLLAGGDPRARVNSAKHCRRRQAVMRWGLSLSGMPASRRRLPFVSALALAALLVLSLHAAAHEGPAIRAGSELDFRPYCFTDSDGRPAGFGVELLRAVADRMGLRLEITSGPWDTVWNQLVAGQIDVLPVVARTTGREPLVDFSLPHTETFDAFFVPQGRLPLDDIAAASGKEIVVLRSDAAHHELVEGHFDGKVIPVESIPDGLRLIAAGKHDAFLCSKLIGVLECEQAGIQGVQAGPPIPDYKRTFSFAVSKGNVDLLEKLNQGLRIVKADGEYDRIYARWLSGAEERPLTWQDRLWPVLAGAVVLAILVVAWRISREAAKWDDRLLHLLAPQRFATLPAVSRYALAVAIVAVATALRSAVIPWIGAIAPYDLAVIVTVAITVLLGAGPGLLTVVLGNIAVELVVLESWPVMWEVATLVRLGISLAVGVFVVFALHAARVAAVAARENATRLAAFAAGTFEGVVDSRDGRIVDCNEQFAQMVGWAVAELKGMAIVDLTAPEDRAKVVANIRENRESILEHTVVRKDGTRIVVEAHGRSSTSKIAHRYTAIRDITNRKRAEEALAAAKAAAEAASEAKSQFLANMSHELRTPMNAILGMIDVALPKATDPTVQDCLQTAKGSADLLLTLLNDLLDSAKIESGKLELELAPFSLRRMLDQITRVLAVRASEKGLVFYCRVADGTPDAVVGDRMRLQQVLLNLASNAIKFTERGDVEIRVDTQLQQQQARVEFAVRDTGIGIPAASVARLFQPFGQADASMSRRFGGTGLGLSISKSLVEMMGGTIWVESEVNKGSTFCFAVELPLATEPPLDLEAPAVLPAMVCAPLRVLLVEDNPANQKLATYILQDRGHLVEIAGDGQEALCLVERDCYDVILMDVQMPGMNGLEATAAIRTQEQGDVHVPIIAMTAHALPSDRERCLAAGMDGYLAKPLSPPALITLVESFGRDASSSRTDRLETVPREDTSRRPGAAVFNAPEALQRCYRRTDILQEMIRSFCDDCDRLFPDMWAALDRGDVGEVGRLGHRLKGTLSYLAAAPAEEAARQVERIGLRGDAAPADLTTCVQTLERQCTLLKTALAEHFVVAHPEP
jgi:PAS domain S-box-containing protein